MKVSLILEGGGMRGIYTAGVLDFFMDNNIEFLNIIGVSAGALVATSYKSWQKYRSKEIFLKFSYDKRYLSINSLIKTKNIFGVEFIFNTIPDELLPFDYEEFNKNKMQLQAVITNVETGKAEYPVVKTLKDDLDYLIATSSLPFVSRNVTIKDNNYLDGGIADPIPVNYAIQQKYDYHIIVLTRDEHYRKKQHKTLSLLRKYRPYIDFNNVLNNRATNYNQTISKIKSLEEEGKALVIRPTKPVSIDRFEKNPEKLQVLYEEGYNDAANKFNDLINFIKDCDNVNIRNNPSH